ncbi:helix-turn-helix domain-containing protein [Deinococcus aquaedulcis]|uniref:helix-turn-helix domain-containing protein n=1 Tax=Deinococcus aquaedulcis TaxID=2840455 RepID=UPI001C83147C|nr:XRE family transcriptional regulator [Deinococcus aquaedulcis]
MSEVPTAFVGTRLKQAREVFGLSVESLGDMLGVSRQAVDQFEKGKEPSLEVLLKLCSILNKPTSYFVRPVTASYADETIFFRKLKKAPAVEIKSARSIADWIGEVVCLLDEEINFPEVNLPRNLIRHKNPLQITDEEIELAANNLRSYWCLADLPVENVIALLEANGIIVVRMNFHSHDVDGFSVWDKKIDRPIVVLNSDKASAVRSRFDAAHELGHLVMHRWISKDDLKAYDKELERQAHYFASCLLLPEEPFKQQLFTISMLELRALKAYWKVSIAAMIKRLESLNIIDKDESRRIWANYNRRGWKTEEPFDKEWEAESPVLLKEAVELLIESESYNRMQLLERLFPDENYLAKFTNLDPEFYRPVPVVSVKQSPVNLKLAR